MNDYTPPLYRVILARLLSQGTLACVLIAPVYLYFAHAAGRDDLRALCEKNFQPKLHRQVSAKGYFDGRGSCLENGCWENITNSPYRFIEFENTTVRPGDLLQKPGFYRAVKVRSRDPDCDRLVQKDVESRRSTYDFVREGGCLRIDRLNAPEARYGIFMEHQPDIDLHNWWDSSIGVSRAVIKDIQTGEILAEQTFYNLYQNSMPSFSSFRTMLHCESRGIGPADRWPSLLEVKEYLKPE